MIVADASILMELLLNMAIGATTEKQLSRQRRQSTFLT